MTVIQRDNSLTQRIAQNKQDLRTTTKDHAARINQLQSQQKTTAQQAAVTAAVANAAKVTTQTVQVSTGITGPNGQPLYGYSGGSGMFPLANDANTGSSWATGERGFINDLNAAVNFIWQVLQDNGITT